MKVSKKFRKSENLKKRVNKKFKKLLIFKKSEYFETIFLAGKKCYSVSFAK